MGVRLGPRTSKHGGRHLRGGRGEVGGGGGGGGGKDEEDDLHDKYICRDWAVLVCQLRGDGFRVQGPRFIPTVGPPSRS